MFGVRYPCITHPFAANLILGYPAKRFARLACLNHAASVRSEPGSNSSVENRFHAAASKWRRRSDPKLGLTSLTGARKNANDGHATAEAITHRRTPDHPPPGWRSWWANIDPERPESRSTPGSMSPHIPTTTNLFTCQRATAGPTLTASPQNHVAYSPLAVCQPAYRKFLTAPARPGSHSPYRRPADADRRPQRPRGLPEAGPPLRTPRSSAASAQQTR